MNVTHKFVCHRCNTIMNIELIYDDTQPILRYGKPSPYGNNHIRKDIGVQECPECTLYNDAKFMKRAESI